MPIFESSTLEYRLDLVVMNIVNQRLFKPLHENETAQQRH